MTRHHAGEDGRPGTAPDGIPDPARDDDAAGAPPRRGQGLLLSAGAATVALAFVIAAVVALRDGSDGGSRSAATARPSATAAAVTPPGTQVRPVHEALHGIDAICRTKSGRVKQASLARAADTVIDFSRRYPNARFPIDDETGTTLSLLLVTRQGLRDCAPALAARVDRALPPDFRDPSATPS
ncbi:hypothetical protein [Streptomyces longwoodensis]|uniref:hypothetical protein n=1 Tax=Streptomyces longwoodensis TaxID=68231 RepID=UPI0036E5EA34